MMNAAQLESLCWNAAAKAIKAREAFRSNPNVGTATSARLKTLDFFRLMAKRRAQQGRPDLRGAAKASSEAKRVRQFDAADKARRDHYFTHHGF